MPEHVFPSQLDTVISVYRWLLDRGATRVAVAADSCAAMLAMGLAVRARDAGLPLPSALLLISAWVDLEATGGSYDSGSDPFFTRELVRALGAGYLAGADPRDPLASPLTPTFVACRRPIFKSVPRSLCSMTAGGSRSDCETRVWTYA